MHGCKLTGKAIGARKGIGHKVHVCACGATCDDVDVLPPPRHLVIRPDGAA